MSLKADGRFGKFEVRANRPRVDPGSAGVIGGLDFRLAPGTLLGVTGGDQSTDAPLTAGSRQSRVKSWFGGVYGSAAVGPASIDLHAAYGKSDFDLARSIAVSTIIAESAAKADSEQWMVAGTAGLGLQAGRMLLEPYAGARYVHLDLTGFTETGNTSPR